MEKIQEKLEAITNGYVPTFPDINQSKFNTADDVINGIKKLKTELEQELGKEKDLHHRDVKNITPIDFSGIGLDSLKLDSLKQIIGSNFDSIRELVLNYDKISALINIKIGTFDKKTKTIHTLIVDIIKRSNTIKKTINDLFINQTLCFAIRF